MGIELTKALFVRHASGLTAAELTVLGYMCVVALDRPNSKGQPARMYFAGWGPLALALGYDELTDPAKTKVKRAMQGLRTKGFVTPMLDHARHGSRQSYRIDLDESRGSKTDPQEGSDSDPLQGVQNRPLRGSDSDPPRTNTGGSEDLSQDISIASVTELQKARARKETA